MTIAVHVRFSEPVFNPAGNVNFQCFSRLAVKHPEHRFIFIFDKSYGQLDPLPKNVSVLLMGPQIKNRLLQQYWYNYKIPTLLEKVRAGVFIGSDGVCSFRTKIKQGLVLKDSFFLQKTQSAPTGTRYSKNSLKKFVEKAAFLAVSSNYSKSKLIDLYPGAGNKVHLVHVAAEEGINMDQEIMQDVRDSYTDGKSYFLAFITDSTIGNILHILKAFSFFKKRQLSNMQLVLLVSSTKKDGLVNDFANYKYRGEVKIIVPENSVLASQLTAAAYAAIYLPVFAFSEEQSISALRNNVPLITTDHELSKELYGSTALFTATDEKSIAEKMMLIYKDENLRNNLMTGIPTFSALHSWDNVADELWNALDSI